MIKFIGDPSNFDSSGLDQKLVIILISQVLFAALGIGMSTATTCMSEIAWFSRYPGEKWLIIEDLGIIHKIFIDGIWPGKRQNLLVTNIFSGERLDTQAT